MYPNQQQHSPPPPTAPHHSPPGGAYDQYPLTDTHFSPQLMDRNPGYAADPFDDHHQQPIPGNYDSQPLLQHQNSDYRDPYPSSSPYGAPSPHVQMSFPPSPGGDGMHYGEAPRRVPRRYKTGKYLISDVGKEECVQTRLL
jgi:chitin synthase